MRDLDTTGVVVNLRIVSLKQWKVHKYERLHTKWKGILPPIIRYFRDLILNWYGGLLNWKKKDYLTSRLDPTKTKKKSSKKEPPYQS